MESFRSINFSMNERITKYMKSFRSPNFLVNERISFCCFRVRWLPQKFLQVGVCMYNEKMSVCCRLVLLENSVKSCGRTSLAMELRCDLTWFARGVASPQVATTDHAKCFVTQHSAAQRVLVACCRSIPRTRQSCCGGGSTSG